ncbi:MAG: ATP-binding cassette domain-containing protein [Gracilibacteraceae bacterium]|jgi:ABC-2 type transport system ATP-binding protein|nr:ATP-binding cassette domain-containing protein [Gracilibacteraceae bacterium]
MEAILAENLTKTINPRGNKPVYAVRGVDLIVRQGEIFGFLGPNGAGKTTCQRMLTTLLPIDGGRAEIAGFDVTKRADEVRRHIGYVGQLGGADLTATGRENLTLAARVYGLKPAAAKAKVAKLARLLDLEELLDRIVRAYSGGQKRRLEVALGIIHEPKIVFMDEPTTGLDPQNRANLWEHIKTLKSRGITVFLTTHYLDEADALADRLAIMDCGKIVAEGTPAGLKAGISDAEIAERVKRETASHATLDDVFMKMTGRSLRDTGKGAEN